MFREASDTPTFFLLGLLLTGISGGQIFTSLLTNSDHLPLLQELAEWTITMNALMPIGVGVLLADRLPRDSRSRVDELLNALPGTLSIRLIGKYIGTVLATLLPVFAFYSIGIGCALYQSYNIQTVLFGLETFAAIALPGILFVAAFSIACPAILWVPLYQFLFIGYWFWGNLLGPGFGIPTLSTTILTPLGGYMSVGFFGAEGPFNHTTALQGTESLLLLLGISIIVMVVLSKYLTWEQTRR